MGQYLVFLSSPTDVKTERDRAEAISAGRSIGSRDRNDFGIGKEMFDERKQCFDPVLLLESLSSNSSLFPTENQSPLGRLPEFQTAFRNLVGKSQMTGGF